MSKISAVILAKNEEAMIADCIDSVSFCDEVVVIDSGSTDRTVELAKHLGAKVYENHAESFAERRNYGMRKAKGPWVLYVDADERVTVELQETIRKNVLDVRSTQYAAYTINRKNFYFGSHEWPHVEVLERLFKKSKFIEWYGELHESAKIDGEIGGLDGFVKHYTHRDLTSMVNKTIHWSKVEAELRLKAGHPKMFWWRFPRVMITAFFDSYIKQKGWKVGTVGLLESMYQSFSMFITYARLWEMQEKIRNKNEKSKTTN